MNEADKFLSEPNNFRDTNQLMDALDARGYAKDQDWENETTTWIFDDGSKIVVCDDDVSTLDE